MAESAPQKTTQANGAQAEPPRESIDQVRDLLFGSQMRMVDARIQSLDERLQHEASVMRADFDKRLADLDSTMREEFSQHSERLNTERAKRVEDLKALSAELKDSLSSLERRHQSLEKAAGAADAELRDHLLKQSAALSTEIATTSKRLSAELDRITGDLQNEKMDATALAAGLTDLAGRIGATVKQASKKTSA
jgi:hypothetical protein